MAQTMKTRSKATAGQAAELAGLLGQLVTAEAALPDRAATLGVLCDWLADHGREADVRLLLRPEDEDGEEGVERLAWHDPRPVLVAGAMPRPTDVYLADVTGALWGNWGSNRRGHALVRQGHDGVFAGGAALAVALGARLWPAPVGGGGRQRFYRLRPVGDGARFAPGDGSRRLVSMDGWWYGE